MMGGSGSKPEAERDKGLTKDVAGWQQEHDKPYHGRIMYQELAVRLEQVAACLEQVAGHKPVAVHLEQVAACLEQVAGHKPVAVHLELAAACLKQMAVHLELVAVHLKQVAVHKLVAAYLMLVAAYLMLVAAYLMLVAAYLMLVAACLKQVATRREQVTRLEQLEARFEQLEACLEQLEACLELMVTRPELMVAHLELKEMLQDCQHLQLQPTKLECSFPRICLLAYLPRIWLGVKHFLAQNLLLMLMLALSLYRVSNLRVILRYHSGNVLIVDLLPYSRQISGFVLQY